jgi:hypothetical protein
VGSAPSLAKLCSDRIDVIKPTLPLFTGGGGWRAGESHQSLALFNPNHRHIQHKSSPNNAVPLSLQSHSHTESSEGKKEASHPHAAALSPYCSSDKRLLLAFFYLVSRTRIPSVHEPERELIPSALQTIFSTLVRSSIASVSAASYKPRHDQAIIDLPQSFYILAEPCTIGGKVAPSNTDCGRRRWMTAVAVRTTGLLTCAWHASSVSTTETVRPSMVGVPSASRFTSCIAC